MWVCGERVKRSRVKLRLTSSSRSRTAILHLTVTADNFQCSVLLCQLCVDTMSQRQKDESKLPKGLSWTTEKSPVFIFRLRPHFGWALCMHQHTSNTKPPFAHEYAWYSGYYHENEITLLTKKPTAMVQAVYPLQHPADICKSCISLRFVIMRMWASHSDCTMPERRKEIGNIIKSI